MNKFREEQQSRLLDLTQNANTSLDRLKEMGEVRRVAPGRWSSMTDDDGDDDDDDDDHRHYHPSRSSQYVRNHHVTTIIIITTPPP
jgi:hypothetical protein